MTDPKEEDAPLSSLQDGVEPPNALKDRTVKALQNQGLLTDATPSPQRIRRLHPGWLLAASAASLFVGSLLPLNRSAVPKEPTHLLVLHGSIDSSNVSSEEIQRRVAEYTVWARGRGESGELLSGEKLANAGQSLRLSDHEIETGSLPADTERTRIEGFFLLDTDNLDRAMEVAKTCPHLQYGGWIELREIDRE